MEDVRQAGEEILLKAIRDGDEDIDMATFVAMLFFERRLRIDEEKRKAQALTAKSAAIPRWPGIVRSRHLYHHVNALRGMW